MFNQPFRSSDLYLTVLARKNKLTHARLGLAVAKKNAKRAVDRNRIKRIIRESFRLQIPQLGNWDIVVLARKQTVEASSGLLRSSLDKHWNKLKT